MVSSVLATKMVDNTKAGVMGVGTEKKRDSYWKKG